jgi:hypothetical protein
MGQRAPPLRQKRELKHDLNAEAHYQANTFLKGKSFTYVDLSPPTSLVTAHIGHTLSSKWRKVILFAIHSQPLHNTICKNASWSTQQFYMINWRAVEGCLSKLPRVKQSTYCKLMHRILNTNVQNNRYYGKSHLCPMCNYFPETMQHIFHCQHSRMVKFRNIQCTTLWSSLKKLYTPESLLTSIKSGVLLWDRDFPLPLDPSLAPPPSPVPFRDELHPTCLDATSPSPMSSISGETSSAFQTSNTGCSSRQSSADTYSASVDSALAQQTTDIGWTQFHQGRISSQWAEAYYQFNLRSNRLVDKLWWSTAVVKAAMQYSLSLWKFDASSFTVPHQRRLNASCWFHSMTL